MKANPQTQAARRALEILWDIMHCYEELGTASAVQAVQRTHEEARELLATIKDVRICARSRKAKS
jgi:hypothetical protein